MKWQELRSGSFDEIGRLAALPDHELLRVPVDATPAVVRAAYRDLARAYHPDRSSPFMRKHNEEVMKLVNAAYERMCAGRNEEA